MERDTDMKRLFAILIALALLAALAGCGPRAPTDGTDVPGAEASEDETSADLLDEVISLPALPPITQATDPLPVTQPTQAYVPPTLLTTPPNPVPSDPIPQTNPPPGTQTPPTSATIWPVPGCTTVALAFGAGNPPNTGINIADASVNKKTVVSVVKGTVKLAGVDPANPGYGIQVRIDHGNGFMSVYAHLLENSLLVKEGETVGRGQAIARVGSSGDAASPQLHFEVIELSTGKQLNPLDFVKP